MPELHTFSEIQTAAFALIAREPEKATQAKENRHLVGWFVGQVMKELNGNADPGLVRPVVAHAIRVGPKKLASRC